MAQSYYVRHGDSLCDIAEKALGTPKRWPEIAEINQIASIDSFFIGQELQLPSKDFRMTPQPQRETKFCSNSLSTILGEHKTSLAYGRAFFFGVADEFNLSGYKFVRRVAFPLEVTDPNEIKRILNPELYGFSPRDPLSKVSVPGHVTGRTDSKFVSVSTLEKGAPRHGDRVFYINEQKLQNKIVDLETIIEEMNKKITSIETKLNSAIAKNNSPKSIARLKLELSKTKRSLLQAIGDSENLIEGHISPKAIKGITALRTTRVMRWVTGIGIVFTTVDLGTATFESYQKSSLVPLKKASMKAAGGYAGGRLGALAGLRVGAALGTAFTIEFGPLAFLGGAIGGVIGGAIGYFGANYAVEHLYPEDEP